MSIEEEAREFIAEVDGYMGWPAGTTATHYGTPAWTTLAPP